MDHRRAQQRPGVAPLAAALLLLVAATLLGNVVAPGLYLVWTSLGVVALATLARWDGLSPAQWGAGRIGRRVMLATVAVTLLTAGVLVAGTQLPGVQTAFTDARVAGMSGAAVAFAGLVRAPLGTALFEEVAFRGVLLAMLARRMPMRWAVAGSSAAFGAWHALPALGLAEGNAAVAAALGSHPALAAVAAMVAAGLAGAALCLLRVRYDHLLVPYAVHATANSAAYLLAWAAG